MMRAGASVAVLLSLVLSTSGAPASSSVGRPLALGVSTHFDQGWPVDRLDQVRAAGAMSIRDDLPWSKAERVSGQYDFTGEAARAIAAACRRGIDTLVMIAPAHPGYDGGMTAHSPAAQAAYGRFVAATLDHFGDRCIRAVEVGNEINAGGLRFPPAVDTASAYVALLTAVRIAVKPRHPATRILGGSTNVIGIGFLEGIFRAGGLAQMDGVVVHPYRAHSDGLDLELTRLGAAMRRWGTPRPIWATEFGNQFDDPARAAPFLIRMVATLSAAGVERAYWYDLIDEPAYRNIGWFDDRLRLKPAGAAAQFALRLSAAGRAVRLDTGDPNTFVYRFGHDRFVLWGAPRPVRFARGVPVLDAQGRLIATPTQLSEDPVVAFGTIPPRFGASAVLADSLHQFGAAPWSYLGRRASGDTIALQMTDWAWTSFYGAPELRPIELRSDSGVAAGNADNPLAATIRYTAPADQSADLSGCFTKKREGDGLTISLWQAGKPIATEVLDEHGKLARVGIQLRRGETLDIALSPRGDSGGNGFSYRIRLVVPGSKAGLTCV